MSENANWLNGEARKNGLLAKSVSKTAKERVKN